VIGYSQSDCVSDTVFRTIRDVTPTVSITGNSTYCPGYTTTLTAHGGSRYLWSDGSSNNSIEVKADTTVWLVGYSESGCVSDTVRFKVSQEPDWGFSLQGDSVYCKGANITLSASGAVSFLWNIGAKTNKITVNTPGEYAVTGTNSRGCSKKLTIFVTENALPDVDFTLSRPTIDFIQSELECNVVEPKVEVNYTWDLGDGTTTTGTNVQHTYNVSSGTNEYRITLTALSPEGCANSVSKTLEVMMVVPNVFTPNGDGVNDIFMPNVDLSIFDRNGVVLYSGQTGWDGTYKGTKMSNDTYFYEVKYSDKSQQIQILRGHVTLKK
jgi:gliding motility-associated-like protein